MFIADAQLWDGRRMREIGEIVYIDLRRDKDGKVDAFFEGKARGVRANWNVPRDSSRHTVRFWTGLFDSRERKVFDKDIVDLIIRSRFGSKTVRAIIEWSPPSFYAVKLKGGDRVDRYDAIEIVGNVFENPELLP